MQLLLKTSSGFMRIQNPQWEKYVDHLTVTNYLYIKVPKSKTNNYSWLFVSDSSQQIFGLDQKVDAHNHIKQETHGQ